MPDGRSWSKAVEGGRSRLHAGRILQVIRRVLGMPDYDGYVRHVRSCHPGQTVPTERQFFEEYLKARYEGGPTRCC
ncbi:MAG TPA: YbdD/YjiX family protein [Gemmatimonadales bacterium]|jgi:uncharacterized short protein YbdD (DUF466 family)